MRGNSITLFMWGYQQHYRFNVEYRMNNVLKELGLPEVGAECLLVGARVPENLNPNEVCVEPEDGKWPLSLFSDLLTTVEAEVESHPLQKVFYGDEPSMFRHKVSRRLEEMTPRFRPSSLS